MTIDEAIVSLRKSASKSLDYEWQREQYQLAEWLEELKVIKDGSIPIIHGKAELELHDNAIRNKAIDDFVNFANTMPTVETEDGEIRPMWLEEIAEQLKVGGENDNLRR